MKLALVIAILPLRFSKFTWLMVTQGARASAIMSLPGIIRACMLTHCGLVIPWGYKSGSTLAQVMACCPAVPCHYMDKCWLIISKVLWHLSEGIIIRYEVTNQWNKIESCTSEQHPDLPGANELRAHSWHLIREMMNATVLILDPRLYNSHHKVN